MSYTDIDITAKYGGQLLSIIEKMTNSKVNIIFKGEDESISLNKNEFVEVCKEIENGKTQTNN